MLAGVARTGEVVAPVSPNDAGKSALSAALAADLPATGESYGSMGDRWPRGRPGSGPRRSPLPRAAAPPSPSPGGGRTDGARPAGRTPLLLLDEPPRATAASGQRHQELVLRICRERAATGDAVADRAAAVLQDGRIAVDGPPGSAGSTGSPWKC